MKKWVSPFLSLLLIVILLFFYFPFRPFKQTPQEGGKGREGRIVFVQSSKDDRTDEDTHFIQILKQLDETIDGWLKSLNERIESEDVTRFEVRFLEILRNILEWVKEKIDAKIESSKGKGQQRKDRGPFRETRLEFSLFSLKG